MTGDPRPNPPPTWHDRIKIASSLANLAMVAIAYFTLDLAFQESRSNRDEAAEARIAADKQREHEERLADAMQQPCLALERMSNIVPIQYRRSLWHILTDENDRADDSHFQYPTIRNIGSGAALNCSVEFSVTRINEIDLKEPEVNRFPCSPINLMADGTTHFYGLPLCVAIDIDSELEEAEGTITFRWERLNGKKETRTEQFSIYPHYKDKSPYLYLEIKNDI